MSIIHITFLLRTLFNEIHFVGQSIPCDCNLDSQFCRLRTVVSEIIFEVVSWILLSLVLQNQKIEKQWQQSDHSQLEPAHSLHSVVDHSTVFLCEFVHVVQTDSRFIDGLFFFLIIIFVFLLLFVVLILVLLGVLRVFFRTEVKPIHLMRHSKG